MLARRMAEYRGGFESGAAVGTGSEFSLRSARGKRDAARGSRGFEYSGSIRRPSVVSVCGT